MIYTLLIGLIAIFGIITAWPMLFTSKSIKTFKGVSEQNFVNQLTSEGIPERIAITVFNYYRIKARYKAFNPSPGMNISSVFGELQEDVDEAAMDLLKQLHLETPSEAERMDWRGGDIYTPRDMAIWLSWVSENQLQHRSPPTDTSSPAKNEIVRVA